MAYLAFPEGVSGTFAQAPWALPGMAEIEASVAEAPSLSALEWSVVAIARKDPLSTLHAPGRMAMAMGALFGDRRNPRLADPRLEALRRTAVLSWHRGYTVPSAALRAFYEAGYTPGQYELLVDSISAARAKPNQARQ